MHFEEVSQLFEESNQGGRPLHVWLPRLVLTFMVFAVLVFVVYETTVGLGDRDLGKQSMWALIVAMVLLVLLPVVDRLTVLRVTPGSVEATLAEVKVHAMKEVGELEDQEVSKEAQEKILQAESPDQVQAAMAVAVELNVSRVVERVKEAIAQKRKCYVRYKPDAEAPVEAYLVAPFDVKPGKTPATRANDYLWVYSYEHGHVISLRLGRVLGVELSEETFDPAEVMADWKKEESEWNVPRNW